MHYKCLTQSLPPKPPFYRIWAYRKAAWCVDEYPESISRLYQVQGINGLLTLPEIGKNIAGEIAGLLNET